MTIKRVYPEDGKILNQNPLFSKQVQHFLRKFMVQKSALAHGQHHIGRNSVQLT